MHTQKIIVIGGSAGAFSICREIFSQLDPAFPAPILTVIHLSANSRHMASLLARASRLPVREASETQIEPGVIYIAPPNLHLMVRDGFLRLNEGPRENLHRPSVNVLFRSAALAYGSGVIGVVLSGGLDDGTAGLLQIKRCGGTAVVQDPNEAEFPGMPRNACRYVNVDHVAPIAEIPGLLYRLATEPGAAETEHGTSAMSSQEEIIKEDLKSAKPSAHTCPECGGPLFQIEDGALLRYRCRVGHAYGSDSFSYAQKESTESRLWSALQSLMSQADIEEKTGELTQSSGELSKAQIYRERSKQSRRAAELLQQVIKLAQHSELEKPDYD